MIRLISNERGDTPLVEAYRTLRSNLQYVCNQYKCKLICITAATSGEGTSEVAANTALALSKNNNKVLFARSAFLQGLLVMEIDKVPKHLEHSLTD